MVKLLNADIQTKEVLGWKGLHVFHYQMSSCSQKLRIFLNLKGLDWQSHHVDLLTNEHLTPYFLGINPRGLVPVLVEDGSVYIESNDIMLHLEKEHPKLRLMPDDMEHEAVNLLESENALHLDLRTLTFRFMFDPAKPSKTKEDLQRYASTGTGMVRGARDSDIERETSFWNSYIERGVNDDQARQSAQRLREAFDVIDTSLGKTEHILGKDLSMVDIAWLVYAQRLTYAGYPVRELHPHMAAWQARLMKQPTIAKELELPDAVSELVVKRQSELNEAGQTLIDVCFPDLRDKAVTS